MFTLSNLYFVGCAYAGEFNGAFERCDGLRSKWPITFVLSALPLFVRLVQSVKRYADSRLITHLINVSSPYEPYFVKNQWDISNFSPLLTFRVGNAVQGLLARVFTVSGDTKVINCSDFERIIPWLYSSRLFAGRRHGAGFVLWCFTSTLYAIYASAWVNTYDVQLPF